MSTLAANKRAKLDYDISEFFEAGIVLFGHEVKSVKTGHVSLKGAFVTVRQITGGRRDPELVLTNAHIPPYKHGGRLDSYDPTRPRTLLLRHTEIVRLIGKRQVEGLTLVPTRIYTKRGLVKLEFGLGRGRKKYDKRDVIKKRDVERNIRTALKRER